MAARAQTTGEGQLPPFIRKAAGFFFDIAWEENILYYATKWVADTDHLTEVAERYGADFRHHYAETSGNVYGVATYQDGVLSLTDLNNSDFDIYDLDTETGHYRFEGQSYESSEEIPDILIERKRQINDLTD